MRRLTLVSFAMCLALGLASQVETQAKPHIEANSVREPNFREDLFPRTLVNKH